MLVIGFSPAGVNISMLLAWLDLLEPVEQRNIRALDSLAQFWPRAWGYTGRCGYSGPAEPIEWWISFHYSQQGLIWVLRHDPSVVRVIYSS